MVDTPELTSITRDRAVRPLMVAWIFVFVILGTGFAWLSLSPDLPPEPDGSPDQTDHIANVPTTDHDITIASTIPYPDTKIPDEKNEIAPKTESETEDSPTGISLDKAPIEGLVMVGANGPLPVLGPDSMVAWKEYARPYEVQDKNRPKIAILVTGIGLNSKSTDFAIKRLPGQIDLGFSPYGRELQKWMDKGREYGHEAFLMIPTEPLKYPENDPGPHTLLTGASARDNLKKLDWLLSQVTGYVGVINEMGSKFTTSEAAIKPILKDLNGRGLMFLDSRSTRFSVAAKMARRIAMPRALNNLYIDNVINSREIAQNLTILENTAHTYGAALGVARAFPLTVTELESWAKGLKARGIDLVPITAIANQQPIR
ncbi:MAG: divergent polysaccharide deacetylase family protein [Emcibacter sp.]|nr:divergent polysaccharide deacetylase family protein [Emcibacter sp.]